jgi:hypothetical protein
VVVAVVDGHAAETFGDAGGRQGIGSPPSGLGRLKVVKVNADGRAITAMEALVRRRDTVLGTHKVHGATNVLLL